MRVLRLAAAAAALIMLTLPGLAGPFERYDVLRHADYEAATGCSVSIAVYERSLISAADFLAFNGALNRKLNNNLGYARRHTVRLYGDLYRRHHTADGFMEDRCLHPTLRRIGITLQILDADGRYSDIQARSGDFATPNPSLMAATQPGPDAFTMMAQADYVAKTGCTVSADTYEKLGLAFYFVVLRNGYAHGAHQGMRAVLNELHAGHPAADGYLDQGCLIPAISKVATELDLLDAQGRYRPKK